MQRLSRTPIRTERLGAPASGRGAAPGVLAILHEVKAALERYAAAGEPTVIDLRWLAAMPAHLEQLRLALGEGEVRATVYSLGISQVRETGIACVWWISHSDHGDGAQAEMLEIVQTPALLCGDPNAVEGAIRELRARLAARAGCGASGFEYSTLRGEQS